MSCDQPVTRSIKVQTPIIMASGEDLIKVPAPRTVAGFLVVDVDSVGGVSAISSTVLWPGTSACLDSVVAASPISAFVGVPSGTVTVGSRDIKSVV